MADTDSQRKFWLDFIGRVNDRIISRRRSTGVTLWAILIALAYLIYSIIDRFSVLIQNPELFDLLLVSFAIISNILFALFILFGMYVIRSAPPTQDIRLLSPLRRISYQNIKGTGIFLMLCASILNFYIFISISVFSIAKWPYLFFGIYFIIQLITHLFIHIINRIQLKRFYSDAPQITDADTFFSITENRRPMLIIGLVLGIILLIVASFAFISLFNNSTLSSNLHIVKLSLEISALIVLGVLSLGLFAGMHQHQYLEELERKIVIDDMEVKDIRYAFIREYLGESTRDFISETESKLNQYNERCLVIIEDCAKDLDPIANIDQQYSYEIKERRRVICAKATKAMEDYISFIEKKVSHIKYLARKDAFSANKELINNLIDNWRVMNDKVNSSYDSLCEKCRSTHPDIRIGICNRP